MLGQSFFSSETQQWDPQLVIGWHASYVRCKYCLKTTFLASFLKALLRGTKHETTKMQRLDFRVELSIKWAIKISLLGREPWSSGYRRRLMIWRLWVQILAPCTGWTFFSHLFVASIVLMFVWKDPKINDKRGRGWPLLKISLVILVSPFILFVILSLQLIENSVFKNGLSLTSFLFIFHKQTIQFFQPINVKNVHPVYGVGIRTHDLQNMSLIPLPIEVQSLLSLSLSLRFDSIKPKWIFVPKYLPLGTVGK